MFTKKITHMTAKTPGVLREFTPKIAFARDAFRQEISGLPTSLKHAATISYDQRITRASGRPMLGEIAPWLVADILPVRNRAVLETITPAWMSLYAYTLFTDDFLDGSDPRENKPLLIASGLILQRA